MPVSHTLAFPIAHLAEAGLPVPFGFRLEAPPGEVRSPLLLAFFPAFFQTRDVLDFPSLDVVAGPGRVLLKVAP